MVEEERGGVFHPVCFSLGVFKSNDVETRGRQEDSSHTKTL